MANVKWENARRLRIKISIEISRPSQSDPSVFSFSLFPFFVSFSPLLSSDEVTGDETQCQNFFRTFARRQIATLNELSDSIIESDIFSLSFMLLVFQMYEKEKER